MALLFWLSLGLILYTHAGYPLLVWVLARFHPRRAIPEPPEWPGVTLLIAAYNEEAVLAEKLANSLALDYPRDRLDIVVVSDGSTDRTDEIALRFAHEGVRLLRVEGRRGKTAAQNAAAALAAREILVFSDANAIYAPDALRGLVRPFADPSIGCVEGRRADVCAGPSATARHELSYRDWESRIKTWESRAHSCTGATGPIYAVRRALYIPLDPDAISDLMEPMLIMARHRRRHVFEPAARSREAVLEALPREFRRKVRIVTRCLTSLRLYPEVLNPARCGGFALQVISHRLLRWLVPWFALAAFTANLFLLDRPFYLAALLAQLAFAGAALAGAALDRAALGPAVLRLPYYFCAANLATLVASLRCVRGDRVIAWRPERG